jgi:hypothetical protein
MTEREEETDMKLKKLEDDCNERIRYFWKKQIYRECSRPGTIVKRAMHKLK